MNMEWDNGDKRKRKWKWMSGVWQTGETGKRGNEERGIGDEQRSNRLDGNNEKGLPADRGMVKQWNSELGNGKMGERETNLGGATKRDNHAWNREIKRKSGATG